MVAARRTADRTNLRVGYIVALTAVDHVFFETCEGIGERFHFGVRLTQQMQHQPQSRSAPYSRQRCHLVHRLLQYYAGIV